MDNKLYTNKCLGNSGRRNAVDRLVSYDEPTVIWC